MFGVATITQHPAFSMITLENDIAVWKLRELDDTSERNSNAAAASSILSSLSSASSNVSYARLDNGMNTFPGRKTLALGWGASYEGDVGSDVLQEVLLPVVDDATCKEVLGDRVIDTMLCAGGENGRDACQGGILRAVCGEAGKVLRNICTANNTSIDRLWWPAHCSDQFGTARTRWCRQLGNWLRTTRQTGMPCG